MELYIVPNTPNSIILRRKEEEYLKKTMLFAGFGGCNVWQGGGVHPHPPASSEEKPAET
jgi:hypothetical protein